MRVMFLSDFRGRATNEIFYAAGTVVDLDPELAGACFAENVAALVVDEDEASAPEPESDPEPDPTPEPTKRTRRRGAA